MIEDSGKYYLYRHIRLDKNEPFHVGIGTKIKGSSYSKEYSRAFSNTGRNRFWRNVVNKNKNYRIEIVLESNDYSFIKEKEKEFIKLYGRKNLGKGTLTNLTDGGDGVLGRIWTEEDRRKISETKKKNPPIITEERRKQLGSYNLGKKWSDEFREKMKETNIKNGLNLRGKNHPFSKPIFQYSLDGHFIKTWYSSLEIERALNIASSPIRQVLKNKIGITNGFLWTIENHGDFIDYDISKNKGLQRKIIRIDINNGENIIYKNYLDAAKNNFNLTTFKNVRSLQNKLKEVVLKDLIFLGFKWKIV